MFYIVTLIYTSEKQKNVNIKNININIYKFNENEGKNKKKKASRLQRTPIGLICIQPLLIYPLFSEFDKRQTLSAFDSSSTVQSLYFFLQVFYLFHDPVWTNRVRINSYCWCKQTTHNETWFQVCSLTLLVPLNDFLHLNVCLTSNELETVSEYHIHKINLI